MGFRGFVRSARMIPLVDEESEQSYEVKGIEIKHQNPKFHYKIKSDI